MRQGRSAASALGEEERSRLAALTTEEADAQSETVRALAGPGSSPDSRYAWSGFVAQPAIFHRRDRR